MSLASQLFKSIRSIPGGLAGGYIDLDRQQLVQILTMDKQPVDVLNHLVGVSDDLFQGPNVLLIEKLFMEARGDNRDRGNFIKECLISTTDLHLLFLRCRGNPNHMVTFACESDTNLAQALANARGEVARLEAAFRLDQASPRTS
jgi:hypothetical protein